MILKFSLDMRGPRLSLDGERGTTWTLFVAVVAQAIEAAPWDGLVSHRRVLLGVWPTSGRRSRHSRGAMALRHTAEQAYDRVDRLEVLSWARSSTAHFGVLWHLATKRTARLFLSLTDELWPLRKFRRAS